MRNFISPLNYDFKVDKGEVNTSPSLTVEGEAYTVAELLIKHTNGIYPNIGRIGTFEDQNFDGVDLEKVGSMDLAEVDEIKEVNSLKINELKGKLTPKEVKKVQEPIPEPENVQNDGE